MLVRSILWSMMLSYLNRVREPLNGSIIRVRGLLSQVRGDVFSRRPFVMFGLRRRRERRF